MSDDYKPRFSFEITEDQKMRADRLLDNYGIRKAVFGPILNDVLDMIESYGKIAIGAMLSGNVKPRNVLSTMSNADKVGKLVKENKDG